MSKRPIEQKKRRRVAKSLRRASLPAYINLIDYLVTRGHAETRREACDLILSKRVKSESHVLGVKRESVPGPRAGLEMALGREITMVEKDVVSPFVSADLRSSITVSE